MAGLSEAQDLLKKLKAAVSQGDSSKGRSILTQLKLQLVKQPGLQPKYTPSAEATEARQLARDALEQAVLLCVKDQDETAVEHNYQQLRTYYADQRSASPLENKIRGLYLLHLLVHNRIAEFHTQVELIPSKAQQTPEIAHVIQLEQWMMEGAYNKVLDAVNSPGDDYYKAYLTQLQDTVRQEVADCSESAYTQLKVSQAKALLMYPSESELLSHASQANWTVNGGVITFSKEQDLAQPEDEPIALMKYAQTYARELERIV